MEPIAIIGIGCRFPAANGPDEFWNLLHDGVDAITEVPPDRWNVDDLYHADPTAPGKMITRWGGFLDEVDRFDREFFGISPREASAIDPQQRLLLEVTWEALEDAGQVSTALAGSDSGVFVGISTYDYALLQAPRLDGIDAYYGTGVALSIAANRISYMLDLRGPSIAVDTACSSSLVAVHTACQSLWSGESQLAIAGGVNVILSPSFGVNFTKAGVMAPDGRCKTFDARADGYVRGEGAGIVVLKPLERALADHDPIRALIRGGAVRQDGRTNGLMAPNGRSQENVLRAAYRHSGVAAGDVDYIEAHGTGTALGDMMETQALGNVVGRDRPAERPCVIGAVKSNIGHLEAAAGIAGVIKTALMLEHRQIPTSLHVENPNPQIDFGSLRLRVARAREPWPPRKGPVRAGVSSFGFGGTNAHIVLEEAPPARTDAGRGRPHLDGAVLFPISARTPEALRQAAERHLGVLISDGDAGHDLGDLAYTAGARRSHHRHRLALVTSTRDGAADQVRAFLAGTSHAGMTWGDTGPRRRRWLAFVCPGQGPVWWPLDPALREEPALLTTLEECDRLVRAEAGWSLLGQLWAGKDACRLDETDFCQSALFAVQVALANLWRSWGITPDAVVGHSMGEVAAAHLSGALSLDDAVRVICHRGRVIRTVSGRGRMAFIELSADAVRDELRGLEGRLAMAAVNAPTSSVISGDPEAVEQVTARLQERGVFCRALESVDFASHSPQMEPLKGDLARALSDLRPTSTRLPMYSTVTGKVADGGVLDGAYWAENIRTPVLFAAAVDGLLDDGHDVFVELSPHPGLLPSIAQSAQARGRETALLPSLRRDEPPRNVMLTSLGALYATGFEPAWTALHPEPQRPVRLPGYPWQRERCWLAAPGGLAPQPGDHPLLGHHLQLADAAGSHVWESTVSAAAPAFLGDHRVQGIAVFPGAAWLELVLAATAQAYGGRAAVLTAVEFQRMLALDDADAATIQLRTSTADGAGASFRAYARPADDARRRPEWTLHATGTIVPGEPAAEDLPALDLDAVRTRCGNPVAPADLYAAMGSRGLEYGPAFQAVEQLWRGEREALAVLVAPPEVEPETGAYGIHPVLLDAGLQVLAAAFQADTDADDRRPYVPLGIDRVAAQPAGAGAPHRLWAHARLRPGGQDAAVGVTGDVWLADDDGRSVVVLEGVHARRLDSDVRPPARAALDRALYEVRWRRQGRAAPQRPNQSGGGWLIFADGRGVGPALAARLAEGGEPAVLVTPADRYDDADPGRLAIRPDHGDEVRRAVGAARERMGALRGVVHLWSLDDAAAEQDGTAGLRAAQGRGVVNALHLVRALAAEAPTARLWLLTSGVHGIDGSSAPVSVAQAPLWGLGRVAALEYPGLRPTLVDLDPALNAATAEWIAEELRADDAETQVAFRAGERHVARLVRPASPRTAPVNAVREEATYLVTGGLGALGLLVARWLVERGARHLVLVGRRGADDAAEQELRALRDAGAEVRVARADVSDEQALAQVLADAASSMPPIRGVVHAAGVLGDATLGTLDPARLLAVLEPKVAGGWNLHHLTAGLPLDFFVMFSSLAGVLGSPGQGNYAAANAFLDALAWLRTAQDRPALSIAWGPWENTGLSVRPEGAGRFVTRAGVQGIAPASGVEWLGRLLGFKTPQIAVALIDWERWATASAGSAGSLLVSELAAAARTAETAGAAPATADGCPRRGTLTVDDLLAADPADRQGLLESYLHVAIARALDMTPEQLDADQPLNGVGLDSLVAVGMKNQVDADLGMPLPLASALEGASLRQLAAQMLADITTGAPPQRDDGPDEESWEEFEVL